MPQHASFLARWPDAGAVPGFAPAGGRARARSPLLQPGRVAPTAAAPLPRAPLAAAPPCRGHGRLCARPPAPGRRCGRSRRGPALSGGVCGPPSRHGDASPRPLHSCGARSAGRICLSRPPEPSAPARSQDCRTSSAVACLGAIRAPGHRPSAVPAAAAAARAPGRSPCHWRLRARAGHGRPDPVRAPAVQPLAHPAAPVTEPVRCICSTV